MDKELKIPPDTVWVAKAKDDDTNYGYLPITKSVWEENNLKTHFDVAQYFAYEILWGTFGGCLHIGWQVTIGVSNGKEEKTFTLKLAEDENREYFIFVEVGGENATKQ